MGSYNDLEIGEHIVTPGKTITHAAITIMTGLGGYTHPMFNDEEYCRVNTPFKSIVAPGEMILFFMGGLAETSGIFDDTVIALVGLDNIRFISPTHPQDTIRLEMEVKAKRETSGGNKGLVTFSWTCKNQHNQATVEANATLLFKI
jgi:acyl dehydratase